MNLNRPQSLDYNFPNSIKGILDIPKQYKRIPKLYSKNSPLRNKKNLLKVRPRNSDDSFCSVPKTKTRKNSVLEKNYNKIFSTNVENKENKSLRYLSAQRQRILAEIPELGDSCNRTEQQEALNSYKNLQCKIQSVIKSKVPLGFIKLLSKK
jgi:hypothetical protein